MTICRIRVTRDTPVSGAFEWARIGKDGAVLATGAANLAEPPVAGDCEVVLASDLVLLDRVAASPSQQRRLGSALRYLAEELALPDPERLHVAASAGPDRRSLCLAIVDREWLKELLARLDRAKLAARSAFPESLLPPLMPHTWTVVWNAGEGFVRTGENEAFALDVPLQGAAPSALQLALAQARAAGTAPQAVVVRCTGQAAPPDTSAWSTALGIPVEAGPEWRWQEAPRLSALELLHGEFAPRWTAAPWSQRLRRPAIMAAALLALGSTAIALDWGAKARERKRLLAEMVAVYRDTFGEAAVVVEAPLQMRRAHIDLRRQAGHVGPGDFLALLGIASEHLLEPARQRVEAVAYENAVLTVTLRPVAGQQTAAAARDLRARPLPPGYELQLQEAPNGALQLRLQPRQGS